MDTALKLAREKTGLTQVEVAEKANISERQYIRIEQGERDPRTATSILIAQVLNSTVEDLFGAATLDIEERPGGNRAEK